MMDRRCTDDELAWLSQSSSEPTARLAAAEVILIRAERRRDSRRGEQVRKVRWAVENSIEKIEALLELAKKWEAEGAPKSACEEP